jgi:hypothetical protein
LRLIYHRFEGRRVSAFAKPRRDGRFVKKEIAHLYALTPAQRYARTKTIDDYLKEGDLNNALSYLIEY